MTMNFDLYGPARTQAGAPPHPPPTTLAGSGTPPLGEAAPRWPETTDGGKLSQQTSPGGGGFRQGWEGPGPPRGGSSQSGAGISPSRQGTLRSLPDLSRQSGGGSVGSASARGRTRPLPLRCCRWCPAWTGAGRRWMWAGRRSSCCGGGEGRRAGAGGSH